MSTWAVKPVFFLIHNFFVVLKSVLIVGNFKPDKQTSMLMFSELLRRLYSKHYRAELIQPTAYASRILAGPSLLNKYLSYIDKLVLFPIYLFFAAKKFDLIHISDHSNSFYSFCLSPRHCIVTCHDLLAVRGALGDKTVACSASSLGPWLQRLILAGLRRAGSIVFDSQATFRDYQMLGGGPIQQRLSVIPIPLNAPFTALKNKFILSPEEELSVPSQPFLLMVGSSLPRKNRALALKLINFLRVEHKYHLLFAGAPLETSEVAYLNLHNLADRIHSVVNPSHALLNNLYCSAHALIFPSFSEGFGWPIVEAQTCHCPVVASTTTSIPEVGGDAALYADPNDVRAFANHVLALEDKRERTRLIQLGILNTRRFDESVVGDRYLSFALNQ